MGFLNKVMLLGNTTRDPELRQLPSGTPVCHFGMATNRAFKTANGEEREETVFVDCTAFGRLAEIVAQYCPKGRSLFVEGRLHFEAWEDQAGNRRNKLSVIAENVQFVGGAPGQEGAQRPLIPAREPRGTQTATAAKSAATNSVASGPRKKNPPATEPRSPAKKNGKATRDEENRHADQLAEATELQDADLPF